MLTKSQQVEKYLLEQIGRGRWTPGEALDSERDLLEELGVSRTTLRDALNLLAREGIVVRKHRSGTFLAQVPKAGTVAIVASSDHLTSPEGYWYRRLFEEARELVEASGRRAVLSVGYGKTTDEFVSSVRLLEKSFLDDTAGVLSLMNLGPLESRLAEAGVCSVTIEAFECSKYCVVLDYPQMVETAVRTLKDRGYNDFALMCQEWPEDKLSVRVQGELVRLCKSAVGFNDDRLVTFPYSSNSRHAYEAFKEWWARKDRPGAIFFFDDTICDVASRAMLELGIKVPEDLAVITHANMGKKFLFPVPLTGVEWNPKLVVGEAWRILEKLMAGEKVDKGVVYAAPVLRAGRSLGEEKVGEPSHGEAVGAVY